MNRVVLGLVYMELGDPRQVRSPTWGPPPPCKQAPQSVLGFKTGLYKRQQKTDSRLNPVLTHLNVTHTNKVTTQRPCSHLKFNAFRSSVHTNPRSFFTAGKCIDLKTLLKVDQNRNAYISYQRGSSKEHQNENDDQKYRAYLQHPPRVQLTSQRAILSFSNVLVRTVENAPKRQCGHESIDAFSMT